MARDDSTLDRRPHAKSTSDLSGGDLADITASPRSDMSERDGAHQRLAPGQVAALLGLLATALLLTAFGHGLGVAVLAIILLCGFTATSLLKLVSALTPLDPRPIGDLDDADLPIYTVIAPLYREAEVVGELVAALERLDYPRDRLQALIVLEEDDEETHQAVRDLEPPAFIQVLTAPPGAPKTKPRACNLALERARGEFLVIYDAEDAPHPRQLREAAARFAADRPDLACLQAPLRIERDPRFIPAQFALEYAIQFEVVLPFLAKAGLPFPLGGTSNHFRTSSLRAVGGWDPYNVTEDADIGFRLSAAGQRLDVISLPTLEPAPTRFRDWLPQRARWVKGHMQTLAVHARGPAVRTPGSLASLVLTLALSVASSHLHGLLAAWGLIGFVEMVTSHQAPVMRPLDLSLLLLGWASSTMAGLVGLRRAGSPIRLRDLVGTLAYWPMQSLAAARASVQFVRDPYRWDKTPHAPRTGRPAP